MAIRLTHKEAPHLGGHGGPRWRSECRRVEVWTQGFQKYITLGVCDGYFQRYGPLPDTHPSLLLTFWLLTTLCKLEPFRHSWPMRGQIHGGTNEKPGFCRQTEIQTDTNNCEILSPLALWAGSEKMVKLKSQFWGFLMLNEPFFNNN